MQVGIRELKARLSHYLERVRAGETVVITHRGRPVARVDRVESDEPPEELRPLVEAGRLSYKPPRRDLPQPLRLASPGKNLADYVSEQRR